MRVIASSTCKDRWEGKDGRQKESEEEKNIGKHQKNNVKEIFTTDMAREISTPPLPQRYVHDK